MKAMAEKTLSVVDTARQLRCSMKRVYDVIREGKLQATKVDGQWRISCEAVEAWRRRREGEVLDVMSV
jgi:excisionase family DNA binding protein